MITVIGSINMDLVVDTTIFPKQGETVLGNLFTTVPGGKGANQAVAVARLGGDLHMVGAVGQDSFGKELTNNLKVEGIDTQFVYATDEAATGIANILLYEQDNRIIVVPGANALITPKEIDAAKSLIEKSEMVIMQLEIPADTVQYALQVCKDLNVPVLLNPAPAESFNPSWMDLVDYLTPNETECADIFSEDVESALEKYPNKLIVTLGSNGARYFDGKEHIFIEGYKTKAVDTTGAGDTFNGALAYAVTNGQSLKEAVRFANIAASLSVEKFGAQGGMPTLQMVENRLGGQAK
ncbi:ribokinase [Rummeliibacillus sp. TYF005]|uniref:ribokinase n=1 Tax=Rummeliibacillus sp. TYF005 TaxID=2058214 RepID=UPI000F52D41A|nr:ribokinase [Rummeliibacillus sp. TYF005]RPJ95413.1 ribokinase [Rummeliibacillus sp. TYF005]